MALVEASKILRKHLNPFVQYFELGSDTANDDAISALRDANKAMIDPELQSKLNMSVQELDLSFGQTTAWSRRRSAPCATS
jgi:DNA-directed RNA polymerase subunit alpha